MVLLNFYRYNDIDLVYDKEIYDQLREKDVDELLAQHIAHLFIRDSISLFSEKIEQDDTRELDHFEVIFNYLFIILFLILITH